MWTSYSYSVQESSILIHFIYTELYVPVPSHFVLLQEGLRFDRILGGSRRLNYSLQRSACRIHGWMKPVDNVL